MARLVCHTCLLKDDDFRIIGGRNNQKICTDCDQGIIKSVNNLIMQRPVNERIGKQSFNEMYDTNHVLFDMFYYGV